MAWWYARHHSWDRALNRFQDNLRAFAAAHGKPERYHETITVAFMSLVADRLECDGARDLRWEDFAARNPDLLAWNLSILDRYYSPETLASDKAPSGCRIEL